ncbi:MAG: 8-amino-7-oxononanoate synthase [Candidatus Thiodiazotropha sp. (ex Ctena orbiculata)]|uniref:8-amino-7-oxononanoate synthase n=1 Tax=Candidatus Thiodiazotropha taylori TaxID=2792791 RepID=A0A944QUJ7_9GAMM|nr:8-amino-7-oxononanoate synthase [Candidatus Thiodiazotropha taylori]PVV09541.1 MAG: 8-amino-7-oxononanoate synthase [gamma proteobacterium symbiont of Ctena orbiculata]MBT2988955.1 8-amino-7-oxononanoate synthase [Candidatus Thiodiazotropha taylori]MBT2996399.1 8-amino-7-oxononanoate synthase [Candidatus Thiodiazotropha taylori]MBT3000167.1 8-amino-7-oxononanoate synthase [Candidatus Thiodiazotropha taylori]
MNRLTQALQARRNQGLYRSRRVVSTPQQAELVVDGKRVIAFCSNDYLGLASHPEVVEALRQGAEKYGVGSGAAHLITGHNRSHHRLEEALAEFTARPRALLFSTGYMANLGVIGALLKTGDRLFEDRLNHASLVDAGQLTRAKMVRYQHRDPQSLELQLARSDGGQALIATDGVFSMDGDLAPLPELVELARKHRAWLMVDDAHGLGVLGPDGGGILSHYGLGVDDVEILMGTLGKGFGTYGAFVAGSEGLIETLIQQARSYIYTTAPPAALAEATLVSLRLARRESWRRERLNSLVERFRHAAGQIGLPLMESATPIQPILAGSARQAVAWSMKLEEQGVLVSAIRPPTVAEGSARLRITFSANHTDTQLERLLDALAKLPQAVA